jgi:acyl-CoA synthetase (AMP-forming)/AMP-acid ligase II
MIWTSSSPPVAVGGATWHGMVMAAIERHPDQIALVDGVSGASVSYAELGRRVDRISGWLAQHGVGSGDTIAVWAPNMPPWAACALAAMRVGAAVTGINPSWTVDEASAQLGDAGVRTIITTPPLVQPAARLVGGPGVVVIGESFGATPLSQVLAGDYPAVPPATDEDAIALLPYSSGTTGLPKAVPLSHANLVTSVRQVAAVAGFNGHDTVLALAPYFHVLGSVVMMAVPLAVGAKVVTVPQFDPRLVLDVIERYRVTATAVPPPVAAYLARHPAVAERDLSSVQLIAVGGAAFPESVHRELAARLPRCVIGQGWGLTETTAGVCVPDRGNPSPPGTVGRLLPNTELTVVDPDTGQPVGAGQRGELWVRGPQVMAGYRNMAQATSEILDSRGWLHTGDVGYVDADGNVVIVDRLKELIKVDGYQVAPAELEAVLVTHPAIADAAVIGRTDERHGEVPVAYVVATGDLDPDAVRSWLAERVAPYKRVADVIAVDSLPRTPSGKLLRRLLA